MADVTLYGPAYSTFTRTARIVMAEKGVDYDLVEVDLLSGQHQSPEHLARHPFGKVPAFRHGDLVLYETDAIIRYIDLAFEGPSMLPAGAAAQARTAQIIDICSGYAYGPMIGGVFWERGVKPLLGQEMDAAKLEAATPEAAKVASALEAVASAGPFLCGNSFGLADAFLAPIYTYVAMTPEKDTIFGGCPKINAWWGQVSSRPSVADTTPQLG